MTLKNKHTQFDLVVMIYQNIEMEIWIDSKKPKIHYCYLV